MELAKGTEEKNEEERVSLGGARNIQLVGDIWEEKRSGERDEDEEEEQ